MPYFNYKQNLLNHFKDLQPVLERLGAEASLNARNFQLELRAEGRTYTLCPQFLKSENGARRYTPFLEPDVISFVGWTPYFNRRWDLSSEKLKFKVYATANGLATPEYSAAADADMQDVVIKKSVSSFSEGVKGPFRSARQSAKKHPLEPGEYYERYIAGRSAKIYYLESRPICLELEAGATVTGDGRRTLRQLLAGRARKKAHAIKFNAQAMYLRYVGRSLDDVPEAGAVQQVDFRYGSVFATPADLEAIDLCKRPIPEMEPQLEAIGECLLRGIPDGLRAGTLFTADAILDADGKLWLVEMNSNPFIHPCLYPAMLDSLFRSGSPQQVRMPQRASNGLQSANETFQLGMVQFNSGAIEHAIALWNRVLQAQPGHAGALYHAGLACARAGRLEEARRALETFVYTVPGDNVYAGPARDLLRAIGGTGGRVAPAQAMSPGVPPDLHPGVP